MIIIHTAAPAPEQITQLQSLVSLCRRMEGLNLSCPLDADDFWLLVEDSETLSGELGMAASAAGAQALGSSTGAAETQVIGSSAGAAGAQVFGSSAGAAGDPAHSLGTLCACIAVYRMEEGLWECSAFTAPHMRRKGYFTMLLEQVLSWGEAFGEPCLCFVADNRCPAARLALSNLGAELSHHEHMMVCNLQEPPACLPGPGASRLVLEAPASPLPDEFTITARLSRPGLHTAGFSAGSCRICVLGSRAYLYSLEIAPELRGQGLGTEFILKILKLLGNAGCLSLRLQVSGDNLPALGLYKKTGFLISETLSYYLY